MKSKATQPLSVCHVLSGDRWAGAEVQVATLIAALCRRGVRVSAIVLNEGRAADELRKAGATVKLIPESSLGFLRIAAAAVPFVRQRGVQILHSHRYKENLLAQLLALRCGIPITVQTRHGMAEPFHGWNSLRQRVQQQLDHWGARLFADTICSVSREMEPALRCAYGGRKVVTIRNGIDTTAVASALSREDARARIGCNSAPVIGIVGRLEPIKRVDLFLAMARKVAEQLPDARFVVAGDGSLRESLTASSHSSGLADKVLFLGHRDDIHDVLRALDVLVMCSDHEGLPMVLLEAMWLGVPVVARAVGGITEVLDDGCNGMAVASADPRDLADSCLRLLADRALAKRICASAAKVVRDEFSVERNADDVLRLYHSLREG